MNIQNKHEKDELLRLLSLEITQLRKENAQLLRAKADLQADKDELRRDKEDLRRYNTFLRESKQRYLLNLNPFVINN